MAATDVAKVEREAARLSREEQFELLQRLVERLRGRDAAHRRARLAAWVRHLEARAEEPDDHDDAWWEDLERDLRENRLTFRTPEELGMGA